LTVSGIGDLRNSVNADDRPETLATRDYGEI
jgi:hypothetical protein